MSKKITTLSFFMFIVAILEAQVSINNELKSYINASFSYFPKIKEIENTVATAKIKAEIAAIDKPVVDGNLSYRYVKPKIEIPIGGTPFQFAPVHNADGNIAATYQLYDFGKLKASVERAKYDIQYAEHNVESAKLQLAAQVSSEYYTVIYLKKAIAIEDSVINFLQENLRFVENKLKEGDALPLDKFSIKAIIDQETIRKADFQNTLDKQISLLAYTSGKNSLSDTSFDFRFSDVFSLDPSSALGNSVTNQPDFFLAKDKIQQAQGDVNLIKLGNKPSLNVGALTGIRNGYVPNVNELRFNYNAGIALKIPIYEGDRTKKQVLMAQTSYRQQQLALNSLTATYKKDIEQTITEIQSLHSKIALTESQTALAKYTQALTKLKFTNGTATHLELTNAAANLQKVLLSTLNYRYQLCISTIELSKLCGIKYW